MVQYTYLGQCGFLLDFDGTRIMTDPHFSSYGPDDMRSYPPPCTLMDAAPEAVLISHSHVDHLDPKTIAPYVAAGGQAAFYAPAPECRLLQELGVANWRAARAEQPFSVGPVTVTPIPCAHMELHPDEHGDYHELSYLLSGCGKTVFFGGDMSLYPRPAGAPAAPAHRPAAAAGQRLGRRAPVAGHHRQHRSPAGRAAGSTAGCALLPHAPRRVRLQRLPHRAGCRRRRGIWRSAAPRRAQHPAAGLRPVRSPLFSVGCPACAACILL